MTLIWTAHRPNWHTFEDTSEKIEVNLLEKTTNIVLNYLINHLDVLDVELPAFKTISETVSTTTTTVTTASLEITVFLTALVFRFSWKKFKRSY